MKIYQSIQSGSNGPMAGLGGVLNSSNLEFVEQLNCSLKLLIGSNIDSNINYN